MSKECKNNNCCDICFIPYEGNKSYKMLADVFAGSSMYDDSSEELLLEKGYEKYMNYSSFRYKKDYKVCYKCFVNKYDYNFMYCPICVNMRGYSDIGSTIHQDNCKNCNKEICELRWYNSSENIKFCGYCLKCCQGMKINCKLCGGKYNKRYCDAHTHYNSYNKFRCDEDHCRECCKKAHICMICKDVSNERFKFDWKGIFHPSCFRKIKKLICSKCNKKYDIYYHESYNFDKKICKKCIKN